MKCAQMMAIHNPTFLVYTTIVLVGIGGMRSNRVKPRSRAPAERAMHALDRAQRNNSITRSPDLEAQHCIDLCDIVHIVGIMSIQQAVSSTAKR